MAAKYLEQYDRMKRWYDRFAVLNQGRPHDMPSDNYLDEIYAFFMTCCHLKDWIKNDGTVATAVKQAVEALVPHRTLRQVKRDIKRKHSIVEAHNKSSRPLKLCTDICNSLKHLKPETVERQRSGESPEFGKKQFSLSLGTAPPTINLKYEVTKATRSIDAFQLATDCVRAWDAFLNTNGLK